MSIHDAAVLLSDDETAYALYQAYVEWFASEQAIHVPAPTRHHFGRALFAFRVAHGSRYTEGEMRTAANRIRDMALAACRQNAPTQRREGR